MISGDGRGLSFPDICLTVEEKTRKNLNQEKLNRPGIEPGPGRWETMVLPLDHSGAVVRSTVNREKSLDNLKLTDYNTRSIETECEI